MKNKIIIAVLAVCAVGNQSHAMMKMKLEGGLVGNGGGLMVCRDSNTQAIKKIRLLDYYEAEVQHGITLNLNTLNGTWQQRAQALIDRLLVVSPMRQHLYSQWLSTFEKEAKFIPNMQMSNVPDSGYIGVEKGCEFEQAAIQVQPAFATYSRYYINDDLWQAMDDTNRAGLVLHEFLYREAIGYGHTDSILVRSLSGFLASDQMATMKQFQFTDLLRNAHFEMTDMKVDGLNAKIMVDVTKIWRPAPSSDRAEQSMLEGSLPIALGTCTGDGCSIFKELMPSPMILTSTNSPVVVPANPSNKGTQTNNYIYYLHPWVTAILYENFTFTTLPWLDSRTPGNFGFSYMTDEKQKLVSLSRRDLGTDARGQFQLSEVLPGNRTIDGTLNNVFILEDSSGKPYLEDVEGSYFGDNQLIYNGNGCINFQAFLNSDGVVTGATLDRSGTPMVDPTTGDNCATAYYPSQLTFPVANGLVNMQLEKDTNRGEYALNVKGEYVSGGNMSMINMNSKVRFQCTTTVGSQNMDRACITKLGDLTSSALQQIEIKDQAFLTYDGSESIILSPQVIDLYPTTGFPHTVVISSDVSIKMQDGTVQSFSSGSRVSFTEQGLGIKQ